LSALDVYQVLLDLGGERPEVEIGELVYEEPRALLVVVGQRPQNSALQTHFLFRGI